MYSLRTKTIIGCLMALLVLAPIQSYAQTVTIASDRSATSRLTAAKNTLTAAATSLSSGFLSSLALKEYSLDGIAYGLARKIIQKMVRSTITWINSGFQGSPAFITDLSGFLRGVADEIVGDAIYGSDLAFLCSPFELDVKIALATEFQRQAANEPAQCTLTDVTDNVEGFLQGSFSEGGWAGWFELTQGETNDPNKAYLSSAVDIQARIINAQGQTLTELDWGDGFLSFKVCSDTQEQSGAQKNCTITTPGRVIADQLNKSLGAGQDALITADEINEIIGALLAQLAQQALTGVNGLLGLGGNDSYASRDSSGRSYIEALAVEEPIGASSTEALGLPITQTITDTQDYIDYQNEIVSRIDIAESVYNVQALRIASSSCNVIPPEFPNLLVDERDRAAAATNQQQTNLIALVELEDRYLTATDPSDKDAILSVYLDARTQGLFVESLDVTEAEIFIEFTLREDINDFQARMDRLDLECSREDN